MSTAASFFKGVRDGLVAVGAVVLLAALVFLGFVAGLVVTWVAVHAAVAAIEWLGVD